MGVTSISAFNGDGLLGHGKASQPQTIADMGRVKGWQHQRRRWRAGGPTSELTSMTFKVSSNSHIRSRLYQMMGEE